MRRRPREEGSVVVPLASSGAGPLLAVGASVLVHVGIALSFPEPMGFGGAERESQPVYFDLHSVLPPSAPEPKLAALPESEPEPERVRLRPRQREVVVRWERLEEPPPPAEPAPAAEAPEDDLSEPPGDPNATPEASEPEGPVQATVASVEGGLAVGAPAGPGSDGAVNGSLRAGAARRGPGARSAPLVIDPALERAWMRRVFHAMDKPQPPLSLRRTGVTGRVRVSFEVAPDGRVLSVRLRESGGHELLDEAALEYARSVRRVIPPPPELHWAERARRDRRITLPIRYGS